MRPLKLIIQAFGPFAHKQVLDFTDLGDHPLFLISGPTGAGKTTILDAICYALYGVSSGKERDAGGMRSHHAAEDVSTEVSLEFALGEKRYRVARTPDQFRPKLRGEGVTKAPQTAHLWEMGEEEKVLAARWGDTSKKVEELIGFQEEQFRQVIMLPQGRFRDLLTAETARREEILKTLFQTEVYSRIQSALKGKAGDLGAQLRALRDKHKTLLEQTGQADQSHLDGYLLGLAEQLATQQQRVREAEKIEQQISAAQALAHQHQQRLEEQTKAHALLMAQLQHKPEMDALRADVQQAQQAVALDDAYQHLLRLGQQITAQEHRFQVDTGAQQQASKTAQHAVVAYEAEQQRQTEREGMQKHIIELQSHHQAASAIAQAQTVLQQASTQRQLEVQAEQGLLAAQQASEDQLKSVAEGLEQWAAQAARIDVLTKDVEALSRDLEDQLVLDQGRVEIQTLEQTLAVGREHQQALEDEQGTLHHELKQARDHWQRGQASVLAAQLRPDQACPVCGSEHHPHPSTADLFGVSDERLKALEQRLEEHDSRCAQGRNTQHKRQTELSALSNRLELLGAKLKHRQGQTAAQLTSELQITQQTLSAAHEAAQTLKVQQRLKQTLEQTLQQQSDALKQQTLVSHKAQEAEVVARTTVHEREAHVPAQWRDMSALTLALNEAQQTLKNQEIAYQQAREQLQQSNNTLAAANIAEQRSKEALTQLLTQQKQDQARWLERAQTVGFDTEQAFISARMDETALQSKVQRLGAYDTDIHALSDRFERAKEDCKDLKQPDLGAINAQSDAAKQSLRECLTETATLQEQYRGLEATSIALNKIADEIRQVEKVYAIAGRIADVANGDNPHRMTFQRFVLTTLLDDVLTAASERLKRMSNGRYLLQRSRDVGDQRRQGGLDLVVEDAYTGQLRPVQTLSGGESFQAALSLAMGLAEVVQAYSGGIRLDTIFIDEGFGSLDPEALDLAVKTLIDLQKAGRMVGVISHVPEMKDQIDVRLDVIARRNGSTAVFLKA